MSTGNYAHEVDGVCGPVSIAPMEIGKRIRRLRLGMGMKQVELARAIGTSTANVSRWESGSQPTPEFLNKLSMFFGISVGDLIGNLDIAPTQTVRVIGTVEAGAWRETYELPPSEVYEVPVPEDRKYAGAFGLQVRGRSMDLHYPPGTTLICKLVGEMPREPRRNDHVIAIRALGGEVEATVKELVIDDDGSAWLWPRSSDPRHQQPIPAILAPCDTAAPESATIHAIVLAAFLERP